MKRNHLIVSLFAFTACTLPTDEDETGDPTDAPSESSGTDPSTTAPTSTTTTAETGTTDVDTSGTDDPTTGVDTSGGETDDPPATNCVDASLLMGNPYFGGDLEGWNTEGQGMLDDPPLRSRHLASIGDGRLAIETQFEVWVAEAGQMHRIAGMETDPSDTRYEPNGACADVRLLIATGVAGLPDGRIVVADTRGNGVIELRDPFGDCQASAIAGNHETTLDVDVPGPGTAAPGDVDGPGATALFNGVERPVTDEDGNIFVVDVGNKKLKRIADDADRTVSTLFTYPDGLVMAMTAFDGTVYMSGTVGGDDFLWAIDEETGEQEVLIQGELPFDELDGAGSALPYGLTNDGVDVLMASGQGYIFRFSTAGEPLGVVAGIGKVTDFPADLDLAMPIPVAELPLRSYATALADLVRAGDDVLFTGNANGVGFHVWSIHCG